MEKDNSDVHSLSNQIPRSRSDKLLVVEKPMTDELVGRSRSELGQNPVKSMEDDSKTTRQLLDLNKVASTFGKPEMEQGSNLKGFEWDLNEEDVSSSLNCNNFKLAVEDSECGSTTGSLEGDSVQEWKQMKQNGFLSSSHGGIPMPKKRERKSNKIDGLKQKIELAKKEQVHRFARMAAPSGLLNGLNPGIINHVRNSKQVHSIIEALLRSKKQGQTKTGKNEKDPKVVDQIARDSETSGTTVERVLENNHGCLTFSQGSEDDDLTLKLCSSTITGESEKSCSLSNETVVSHLSVKAAGVASQWLDLLRRDFNGRLSALRRSKKRVRDVIQTELPLMLSREFSNDNKSGNANAHRSRWHVLFAQMEKTLCEEEQHLENKLNQVTEMYLQCNKGYRLTSVDRELAIRAAAASIYSTCNFLQTTTTSLTDS